MKNKKIYKVVIAILLMCSVFGLNKTTIHAAGISVYASSSTASPNETVNVTVSGLKKISGRFDITVSNGRANVSKFWIDGESSYSFEVTVGSSGTTFVNVSASDAATSTGGPVSGDSTSIRITKPSSGGGSSSGGSSSGGTTSGGSTSGGTTSNGTTTTTPDNDEKEKSKNNNLSSLTVSSGTLSPVFKSGTTSYKVQLPASAKSFKISATAADSKAQVSGTGEQMLEPGNNTFKVTCTAEDNSYKVYEILAYVDEKPLVYITYNGAKLGVARNTSKAEALSKLFTKTSLTIDKQKVDAWKSKALGITLLYMQSDKGNGYYIYDDVKNELTSVYEPMGILGKNIAKIDVPKVLQTRAGMKFTTVKVDGKEFQGWTYDDETMKNFVLIYVMDNTGKYVYYQYEKTQNNLQLYSGAASVSQDVYNKAIKDLKELETTKEELSTFKTITYILGGVASLLLLSTIGFAVRKKGNGKRYQKANYDATNHSSTIDIETESLHHQE